MLACSGARALAQSLMQVRPSGGCDGPTPTHAEVVSEHRHVSVVGWGLELFSCGTVTDFSFAKKNASPTRTPRNPHLPTSQS